MPIAYINPWGKVKLKKNNFVSSFDSAVYMDDTEGLFVIGGSDTTPGFSGFIGKLQWYRNKAVESDQVWKSY